MTSTGLGGWDLTQERVDAGGIVATRARVEVMDPDTARPAEELLVLVRRAQPAEVAAVAASAVGALAWVEGRLHDQDPATVDLHEIGSLDTVVDTVGVAAGVHLLGIERVVSAPLGMGVGSVSTQHGQLPAPAPATLALLEGAHIVGSGVPGETVTPTGAALLQALNTRYAPLPPMQVARAGYGAGTRTFSNRPNVLQAVLGSPIGTVDSLIVLETNIDDVTGEILGDVIAAALELGAADAWITPAIMKKGRPAHVVHVLSSPDKVAALAALLFAETGTLGLRRSTVHRPSLQRVTTTVLIDGQRIRLKHGPWGVKPEHDDLVAAAKALGRPLRDITVQALATAHETLEGPEH